MKKRLFRWSDTCRFLFWIFYASICKDLYLQKKSINLNASITPRISHYGKDLESPAAFVFVKQDKKQDKIAAKSANYNFIKSNRARKYLHLNVDVIVGSGTLRELLAFRGDKCIMQVSTRIRSEPDSFTAGRIGKVRSVVLFTTKSGFDTDAPEYYTAKKQVHLL